MADLLDAVGRFTGLITSATREGAEERVQEEAPLPEPDAEIRNALGGWAMDERARKQFIPWLEQEMERAVETAHINHTSHAEMAYDLGFEQGLRFVRDKMRAWARG